MTFSLRKKRRTTRRERITSARTLTSALAAWLLLAGAAAGQGVLPPPRTLPPPPAVERAEQQEPGDVLRYPQQTKYVRTAAQLTGAARSGEEDVEFNIRARLPDPHALFQRISEAQLFEQIRQEHNKRPAPTRPAVFPEEPVIGNGPYTGRSFPMRVSRVEPGYVCHRRLYFEQKNFERQGWDLGILQPGICLGVFYYDVLTLPNRVWTNACENYDCSAGKCLPGDPTPLLLYRQRWSITGLAASIGTYVGAGFVFR